MRQGAHWCDFQRHVALFNSLFYYIKAHIFDKNWHFLRKKAKMCAFDFRIIGNSGEWLTILTEAMWENDKTFGT